MPGSIDAGGVVVAEISYENLKIIYDGITEWKVPFIVRTAELSDFLKRESERVNSLLKEKSLGQIIHDNEALEYYFNLALRK